MTAFPGAEAIVNGVFIVCVLTTVLGGVLAVQSRRIIRGVCGLAICCFGLAGLYYFLRSPFLALMEILIYVGAVCVTIVFAVMLAEPDEQLENAPSRFSLVWGGGAALVSLAVFAGIVCLGLGQQWVQSGDRTTDGSVAAIGRGLLTTYSMPFELISLVLLVAILGALAIARYGRTKA